MIHTLSIKTKWFNSLNEVKKCPLFIFQVYYIFLFLIFKQQKKSSKKFFALKCIFYSSLEFLNKKLKINPLTINPKITCRVRSSQANPIIQFCYTSNSTKSNYQLFPVFFLFLSFFGGNLMSFPLYHIYTYIFCFHYFFSLLIYF